MIPILSPHTSLCCSLFGFIYHPFVLQSSVSSRLLCCVCLSSVFLSYPNRSLCHSLPLGLQRNESQFSHFTHHLFILPHDSFFLFILLCKCIILIPSLFPNSFHFSPFSPPLNMFQSFLFPLYYYFCSNLVIILPLCLSSFRRYLSRFFLHPFRVSPFSLSFPLFSRQRTFRLFLSPPSTLFLGSFSCSNVRIGMFVYVVKRMDREESQTAGHQSRQERKRLKKREVKR